MTKPVEHYYHASQALMQANLWPSEKYQMRRQFEIKAGFFFLLIIIIKRKLYLLLI